MCRGNDTTPPVKLQAWLEQHGLAAADAAPLTAGLARAFNSEQAALESLPDTFAWLRGRGLSSLETARLLNSMADMRHDSVVNFAATAQLDYELIDSTVAAYLHQRQQRPAGTLRHRTRASLADVLRSSVGTARCLIMPSGHVKAWLQEVRKQLSDAELGRLLLSQPSIVGGRPATAQAAVAWAVQVLGVTDLVPFLARNPPLLTYDVATLQASLDALQSIVPAEEARQSVQAWPRLISTRISTMQAAAAWLEQRIADADQLHEVLLRCPPLLAADVGRLQRNACFLAGELGWQHGDGQLAAFVLRHPHPFALLDCEGAEVQVMLRFFSGVVGAPREDCLGKYGSYLIHSLDRIVARYVHVQVRRDQCQHT